MAFKSILQDIWRYHVSVCIATGIGVTPFASIINELRLADIFNSKTLTLEKISSF